MDRSNITIAFILVCCLIVQAQNTDNITQSPSRSTCVYKRGNIVIDGKLSESSWRHAKKITDFSLLNTEEQPRYSTTAQMLWDDESLYVAFSCEDEDIWAKWREFDEPLWENEVVEVFIDPNDDGIDYKEFEVNPANTVVDLNIPQAKNGNPGDWRKNRKWNATGMKTAVKVDGTVNNRNDKDRKWTVEIKIPFKNFKTGAPSTSDVWRIQLYRIDRPEGQKEPELYLWSPTDAFHKPQRFGYVKFIHSP